MPLASFVSRLTRFFVFTTTLVALVVATASAAAPKRPNILWLIAEDMGPELACYGTTEVATPTIDRLAHQGMRFTRAFTTAPVCSASRSAFITGMYQTRIGAHNHRSHRDDGFALPAGVEIISRRMQKAGYFTANVRHFPPEVGFAGTGKNDWNFQIDGEPFDSDRFDDLPAHQPFYAQVNFQESHRPFRARRRPTRQRCRFRLTIPIMRSRGPTGPRISTP